ncbi:hypothetical protein Barb7_02841 [Bacteroidales bacterium Barb7]|nr:hypothetical protein Barb7_02841 [Bacteroidales bacterium Barb7]
MGKGSGRQLFETAGQGRHFGQGGAKGEGIHSKGCYVCQTPAGADYAGQGGTVGKGFIANRLEGGAGDAYVRQDTAGIKGLVEYNVQFFACRSGFGNSYANQRGAVEKGFYVNFCNAGGKGYGSENLVVGKGFLQNCFYGVRDSVGSETNGVGDENVFYEAILVGFAYCGGMVILVEGISYAVNVTVK